MKILLDTNIIIHREANKIVREDIGQLFNWIDKLHYEKFVHPITTNELAKHVDKELVKTMHYKLKSYNELKTLASISPQIQNIIDNVDKTDNDKNDSKLLNELLNQRVDILITEDKNLTNKASLLNISNNVYNISSFLEAVLSTYPDLIDYKVLSVKLDYFGNININDEFFNSFREQYEGFNNWFNKKSQEKAYVCYYEEKIRGFLYLKYESENENYNNVSPPFLPKKRLKVGSFKITLYGFKLGERFLKIIFDNALKQNVDDIYFTVFDDTPDRKALVNLCNSFGFYYWGLKKNKYGNESIFVRKFNKEININNPKLSFPYISHSSKIHFISIYPDYHTELFPDSILNTESPSDFVDNQPHRNAISKVYISHAYERNLNPSDIIVFYRTGGIFKGVVSTIGVVESIKTNFKDENDFYKACRGKTVLSNTELNKYWNRFDTLKPFVINFLYTCSLNKRPNLKALVDNNIFSEPKLPQRGIFQINWNDFIKIIKLSNTNESFIIY
jgi:predicted nucleic acid-binding protein